MTQLARINGPVMVGGVPHEPILLKSEGEIRERVAEMGAELARSYMERYGRVHVLTVMNGAKHFSSDLERAMQEAEPGLNMTSDALRLKSYSEASSSGVVREISRPAFPFGGEHVLVVEDVYDTGITFGWLKANIEALGPKSLEMAVLFDKDVPGKNRKALGNTALHVGFGIPNEFIIGYGLDFNEQYRNLRDVYSLQPLGEA